MFRLPQIIQGGKGVGVSNWRLAHAVSKAGQLGEVSGTALDQVFVRRLVDGDREGHMRRAVDALPFPEIASRIWAEYFVAGHNEVLIQQHRCISVGRRLRLRNRACWPTSPKCSWPAKATGVQVGTAFAFSRESGLRDDLKSRLLAQAAAGTGRVYSTPLASPTGYPFKIGQLDGSLSDASV